jgi:hypothetical protein
VIIERSVAASRLPGGPGRFEQKLRGHHGGLEPAEAGTWIGALEP